MAKRTTRQILIDRLSQCVKYTDDILVLLQTAEETSEGRINLFVEQMEVIVALTVRYKAVLNDFLSEFRKE